MVYPWRADRWRAHCLDVIADHWDRKLKQAAEVMDSLYLLDVPSLSIMKPAKIWSMAGLDAQEVKKAAVVNWMSLGVYKSREILHKMKIVKSPMCTACSTNSVGSLAHYLLYCPYTEAIRQQYVPKFIVANPKVARLAGNEEALIISILDPESSLLPEEIRYNWESSTRIYAMSRDYVYNVHKKFEKFYNVKS